jgi:hypothetical protein
VISGFYHEVYEIYALLWNYTAYGDNSIHTFLNNILVPSSRVQTRFLTLEDGTIRCIRVISQKSAHVNIFVNTDWNEYVLTLNLQQPWVKPDLVLLYIRRIFLLFFKNILRHQMHSIRAGFLGKKPSFTPTKENEELICIFMFCKNRPRDKVHVWPDGSNVPRIWIWFNFSVNEILIFILVLNTDGCVIY